MKRPGDVEIAKRVRALIGGQDRETLEATAARLGVTEVALRMTIDRWSPHAVLNVLAALVRVYGVDPSWLVTGEYDPATHHVALEQGESFRGTDLLRLHVAAEHPTLRREK
ncbi:MAG TPA: hypothetical protein VGP95_20585 [Gemmatimonadaceae bacterium]|jgi:hypothetical protein|nr:hypothetical protein [Gemmatimonadaceae bacterium]